MAKKAKCKHGRRVSGKCPPKKKGGRGKLVKKGGPKKRRGSTRAQRYWENLASDTRWEFNWKGQGWNEVFATDEATAWKLAQEKGREFGLTPVRSTLKKNYYGTYMDGLP